MNSASTLQGALKTDNELFLAALSSLALIDIGTIVEVKNGRARVNGSSFIGGKQVIYQDAEIIFPGNSSGAFTADCAGTACLIFLPCSCMPSTDDRKVLIAAAPYDKSGVKAMPIGNGASAVVKTYIDSLGAFNIVTKAYGATFKEDAVHIERNDAKASVSMDEEGGLHIIKQGDNSTLYVNMVDGATEKKWLSKDKDVLWVDTLNQDGSRSFVQKDPRDDEADPLFSLTVAADGTISLSGAKPASLAITGDVSLDVTDGDVSVNADNINLNGDSKRLVTYAELKAAMDKLWIAMTTTPIAGNGAPQPSWTGITSIDISASETQTIKTGG